MTVAFRIFALSLILCIHVVSTRAGDADSSPPKSNEDVIKKLDAILDRVRADALKTSGDSCVEGVGRSGEKGSVKKVSRVDISPNTHIGCGCCGEGPAKSSFFDDDLATVAALDGLTSLMINRSGITDDGLKHLADLSELQELDLSENAISDEGLKHLANLTKLRALKLRETQIDGSGLIHLAKLQKLRVLDLGQTRVTGEGMKILEKLPLLEELIVEGTKLDDNGLSNLARLKQLQKLSLRDTKVSDDGLVHLGDLTTLRDLNLRGTQVRSEGLLHLANLEQLYQLDFQPTWTKELAAVLSRWKKLQYLRIMVPDPAALPTSERQIELYGMESLYHLTLICQHGAEAIDLRDMPNLKDVSVSIGRGDDAPRPHFGRIRISNVKSLDYLSIPVPEQLELPNLERIGTLSIHGVLKPDSLGALRKIKYRQIGLHASPDSQPSVLSVFNDTIRALRQQTTTLWLYADTLDAAWLKQLGQLSPSPNQIRVRAKAFAGNETIDLNKLGGLERLYIRISAPDPVAMPRLVLVGPQSLRFLSLSGFQTKELCCKGWFPGSLEVPSASRIVVSDVDVKKAFIPLGDKINEFEVHTAPQLEVVAFPSKSLMNLQKMIIKDAPRLRELSILAPKLSVLNLVGSFPDIRNIFVGNTAIGDVFLAQAEKMSKLEILDIQDCKNLSSDAISAFRKARPNVEVRADRTDTNDTQSKSQQRPKKIVTPPSARNNEQ